MMLPAKDIQIIKHILRYCEEIDIAVKRFGDDKLLFSNDFAYKNCVCMSMLQIGELVKRLSPEFTSKYAQINWKGLAGGRDMFAHSYQKIDTNIIWDAVKNEIPDVKNFCIDFLDQ